MNVLIQFQAVLTPLTKLGELGSGQAYDCVLRSKAGDFINDNIETWYFHKGSTKKSLNHVDQVPQIAVSNDIMQIKGFVWLQICC